MEENKKFEENSKEKKCNSTLKIVRNILLIVIVLFLIVLVRRLFILTNLYNKEQKITNNKNYHLKLVSLYGEEMNIVEEYYKDGEFLFTMTMCSKEKDKITLTNYKSNTDCFVLTDTNEIKQLQKQTNISNVTPISFNDNNLSYNLWLSLTANIDKTKLYGKDCYVIRDQYTEKYIDATTGLPLKMVNKADNSTVNYTYEFGTVKNSDVTRPDTTDYVEVTR